MQQMEDQSQAAAFHWKTLPIKFCKARKLSACIVVILPQHSGLMPSSSAGRVRPDSEPSLHTDSPPRAIMSGGTTKWMCVYEVRAIMSGGTTKWLWVYEVRTRTRRRIFLSREQVLISVNENELILTTIHCARVRVMGGSRVVSRLVRINFWLNNKPTVRLIN